jgi:hypothetical protein
MGGAVKAISNAVSSVVDFVGKTVEKVVDFAVNVVTGVLKNVVGVVAGAITGDWTKFRDSLLGVVSTALYGTAAVVGFVTGQYYITAAALVALDGQYNEGKLTSHIVTTVGKFEREIFGSKNILDNVDIITSGIVIIGSLYAAGQGIAMLSKITGLTSYLANYADYVNYFKVATGAYSVYDAYTQWQQALELYDKLMSDYQAFLNQANREVQQFNQMWDAVYGDLNVWYEAMPGGYLFNAGVGSDEYSISSINEQSAYCLALNTKRDVDFDRYFTNPFEIDYVGLNIDDIKPEDLKYKD